MSMAKSEQPKTESEIDNTRNIIGHALGNETQDETEPMSNKANEKSRSKSPKKLPQFQYDRRFMLEISRKAFCQKWPVCLSADHLNSSGLWDPEKWFREKHSSSPALSDEIHLNKRPLEHDIRESKKRFTDPKERIKEEMQDDIVLSPQRRSFGTGCHVTSQRRLGSPIDVHDISQKDTGLSRDSQTNRRIGSGRLGNRNSSDRQESDREYGYRPSSHRDFNSRFRDKDHDRSKRNSRGSRMLERAHSQEPEWYSDGPVSQSEFIELRGFDEPTENGEEEKSPSSESPRNAKKTSTPTNGSSHETGTTAAKGSLLHGEKNGSLETNESSSPSNSDPTQGIHSNDFDVNEFFKNEHFTGFPMMIPADSLHGLSQSPENDLGGSRFSRWKSGVPMPTSRNFSPIQTEKDAQNFDFVSRLLDETDARNMVPSPPPPPMNLPSNQKNILEILQSANINVGPQQLSDLSANNAQLKQQAMQGKAKSVEELEAGLRQLVFGKENRVKTEADALKKYLRGSGQQSQENVYSHREDNAAYNKLISSINENCQPFKNQTVGPPIDKSRAMSEKQLLQDMLGDESKLPKNPNHLKNEPTEQEMLNSMFNPGPQQYNAIAKMMKQQELLRRISPVPSDYLTAIGHPGSFSGRDQGMNHPQNQSGIQQKEMLMSLLKQHPTPAIQQTASPVMNHQLFIPPLGHISPANSPLLPDSYPQQQRAPSPLVFSQQPPMISHAPSPIHPTQGLQAITPITPIAPIAPIAPITPIAPISPINPINPITPQNTLQVQGSPTLPRVLSPQQLVARTQAIYHNALIQKKVEEQQGNYRRKQEHQQRSFSPSSMQQNETQKPDLVQAKVTMATFTPTSVMRRMHSESKSEVKSNGSGSNESDLQLSQGSASSARNGHPRPLHGQGVMNSQGTIVGKAATAPPSIQSQVSPPRPIIKANNPSSGSYSSRQSSNETASQSTGRSIHGSCDNKMMDQHYKTMEQQNIKMQQQIYHSRIQPGGQFYPNISTNVPPPSYIVPHGHQSTIPLHVQQQQQQQQQFFRNFVPPQKSQPIRGQTNGSGNQAGGQHNMSFTPPAFNPHTMPPQPIHNAPPLQQMLQNQRFGQQSSAIINDGFNGNALFSAQSNSAVTNSNPANLMKWFGREILKPDLPPVPKQKALFLEDLERQDQVAG